MGKIKNNGKIPGLSSQSAAEEIKIAILINSIYYFLDFVFIISEGDYFNLVVIHNRQLIAYRIYKTVKAAKIAFSRLYWSKAWKEGIRPHWSIFYHPAVEWLNERRKIITKYLH